MYFCSIYTHRWFAVGIVTRCVVDIKMYFLCFSLSQYSNLWIILLISLISSIIGVLHKHSISRAVLIITCLFFKISFSSKVGWNSRGKLIVHYKSRSPQKNNIWTWLIVSRQLKQCDLFKIDVIKMCAYLFRCYLTHRQSCKEYFYFVFCAKNTYWNKLVKIIRSTYLFKYLRINALPILVVFD